MNSNQKKPPARSLTVTSLLFAGILAIPLLGYAKLVTHSYDDLNRLIRSDYGNGTVIEYAYDAAGNRTSQTVTTGAVIVDTDWDDIPDWYEDQYGLNKNNYADAQLDADDDGLTNLAEFMADSNPIVNEAAILIPVLLGPEQSGYWQGTKRPGSLLLQILPVIVK